MRYVTPSIRNMFSTCTTNATDQNVTGKTSVTYLKQCCIVQRQQHPG